MARSSPGVLRVAAILNFVADHPGQSFSLTELVRALKLSRATCHALLTSLVEVGYLYRSSDKHYVLGPVLSDLGRRAAEHASPLQVAQPEMRTLADEFDATCSAFFRDRDEVVVRDRAASVSHLGWSTPLGARLRLRVPFSAAFLAWSPLSEVEAWLDKLASQPTPDQRRVMHDGMAFAREHGYVFCLQNPNFASPELSVERIFGEDRSEFPALVGGDLDLGHDYILASVLAPIFDTRGQIAFVLGLTGLNRRASGAEIERIGRRVRTACDRITAFNGGRLADGPFRIGPTE